MNVKLEPDLYLLFTSSLFSLYKNEIYELVKELEYMTIVEFEAKYSGEKYFEIKGYKIYFSQTQYEITLKTIEFP